VLYYIILSSLRSFQTLFLSQGSINSCKYTKQLSVYQTTVSTPNNSQYTKQLSVYQTTVSVPNNCHYTKQLSVYQTTVSVPNNCQYTKQQSVYQTTVSVPNNCQCTKQFSVYQTIVSIPNKCHCTKQLSMPNCRYSTFQALDNFLTLNNGFIPLVELMGNYQITRTSFLQSSFQGTSVTIIKLWLIPLF
jgi:hypothetical protein